MLPMKSHMYKSPSTAIPTVRDLTVLYEDNHLLILDKPAGLLTVPDSSRAPSLLDSGKEYLKKTRGKAGNVFLGVVHRLDRPVSGIVCFAVTSKAAARISEQIRTHAFRKTYLAVTDRPPPGRAGFIDTCLEKDVSRNLVRVTDVSRADRPCLRARTQWKIVQTVGTYHLMRIYPETGRPHQIRAHLAFIGCPILGDVKYGSNASLPGRMIALHALRVEFLHPVRMEKVVFDATLPDREPWNVFKKKRLNDV